MSVLIVIKINIYQKLYLDFDKLSIYKRFSCGENSYQHTIYSIKSRLVL